MNIINLNSQNNTLTVNQTSPSVQVRQTATTVAIHTTARGLPGAPGEQGEPGSGSTEADKYYVQNLNGETDITVTHNLNKYPSVTVIDSANDEVEGDYKFIDQNNTRLLFSSGFSGKAIFN